MGWRSGRIWEGGSWKPELGILKDRGTQVWGLLMVDSKAPLESSSVFRMACRVVSWTPEGAPAQHYLGLVFFLGQLPGGTALCWVSPPCLLVLWVSGNLQTSKGEDWLRFGKSGCCSQICTKRYMWSEHLWMKGEVWAKCTADL